MRLLRSSFLRDFLKKKSKGVNFLALRKGFVLKGKNLFKKRRNKSNSKKKFNRKWNGSKLLRPGINEIRVPKRKFSTFRGKVWKGGKKMFLGKKKKKSFSFLTKRIRRKRVRRASNITVWEEKNGKALSLLQRILVLKRLNNYFRLRFFLPRFFFKFLRKPLFLYKFSFV